MGGDRECTPFVEYFATALLLSEEKIYSPHQHTTLVHVLGGAVLFLFVTFLQKCFSFGFEVRIVLFSHFGDQLN